MIFRGANGFLIGPIRTTVTVHWPGTDAFSQQKVIDANNAVNLKTTTQK